MSNIISLDWYRKERIKKEGLERTIELNFNRKNLKEKERQEHNKKVIENYKQFDKKKGA